MPSEYNCDNCGKPFQPHPSIIAKYNRGEQKTMCCSRECANELKKRVFI